jgi:hypothetical protein
VTFESMVHDVGEQQAAFDVKAVAEHALVTGQTASADDGAPSASAASATSAVATTTVRGGREAGRDGFIVGG